MSGIDLGDGRTAVVDFEYHEKMMDHLRHAPDKPHRETKVKIAVMEGETEIGIVEASSYCSPLDQFTKSRGRVLAVRRAFQKDTTKSVLPDPYREKIASAVIIPAMQRQKRRR